MIATYTAVPREVMKREIYRAPPPAVSKQDLDEKWKQILEGEEVMIDEINKIYEEDLGLKDRLKDAQDEILESEERYKKARQTYEETLLESEKHLKEYEKLEDLYLARELALKAMEDLYQPCQKQQKCDLQPSEGVVQQRLKQPYRVVRRQSLPADQTNFHDLYESAKHRSSQSASEVALNK